MRKNGVKLRPILVTGITASFMIVSTIVSSLSIVNNSILVRSMEEARAKEAKAQVIEKNMLIR